MTSAAMIPIHILDTQTTGLTAVKSPSVQLPQTQSSHGTRCAGEVSAAANNNICGVGVAYGSKVAGIRMLDQPFMTDIIEASSISHMPQLIDIYSASWGPTDNGKTVDGPRELTLQAMADGVNKGRGGKGSIYVWASGDGGSYNDCNCDGYASSMWTISINSAINDGRTALYDESCSSTLPSTFSNGQKGNPEAGVATTDLYGNCTLRHSRTSAAAPEAAGVFALTLEANAHQRLAFGLSNELVASGNIRVV
ncbi:hypothetical protein MG293_011494 [Ovis ammon polii]|uniref:Proprotein convertase 2 n=1 Tax=Ovis ammon polii TaxID=230172 RepID=A0AAD4Y992_OVIAM|nr:hypothetical protein MG293_011494 [Ovis ammon polii]